MKRDMELIRLSLLEIEREEPASDLFGYTEDQKVYHMALCIEAGLVDGVIVPDGNGYPAATSAIRLTWKGHEFFDVARNDTIWKKTLWGACPEPSPSWCALPAGFAGPL
jgi:hypothetical protein